MSPNRTNQRAPTILIAGASRGLGYAIACEFLKRKWNVIGTVRGDARTSLHELVNEYPGRIEIEQLDINDSGQIEALHERLSDRSLDILFVNAGITTRDEHVHIGKVSTDEYTRVMITKCA